MKKKNMLSGLLLFGYLLGVSKGFVAIWRDEDPEPWLVTKMPVAMLPREDAQALEKGIVLPDDYSLAQALEDYCS